MMDKKKKKTLIISLSIVGVIVLAAIIAMIVLFTRKPDKPPVQEGAIYQTDSQIIWSGVAGVAYISFEYVETPETPEDGKLYGYVFKVMADGSTDVTKCTPWLSGKWELEENNGTYGTLKLTATWNESNSDATKLTGATSGEVKTYTLEGGVYKIGVSFSAGANLTFTMNPNDKLNDGTTSKPNEPCTEHIDANGDGKCDHCDADMPIDSVEVQLTLMAENNNINSKIELLDDNSWKLSMKYDADYVESASGTWAYADTAAYNYNIVLTVVTDVANMLSEESYTLTVNAADQTYSGSIAIAIPQVATLTFEYTTQNDAPQAQLILEDVQISGQVTAYGKLELLTDNTWVVSIAYVQGGTYTKTASGTWSMAQDFSKIILTVTEDDANALASETYDMELDASDQSNILYTVALSMNIPQVGMLNFTFSNAPKVQAVLTATTDGKYAKIELFENNTWKLYMSYYAIEGVPQGYTETASGTWAFVDVAAYNYNMTLTITKDTAEVLANDSYTLTVDETSHLYSGTIHIAVAAAGVDADFAFSQVVA